MLRFVFPAEDLDRRIRTGGQIHHGHTSISLKAVEQKYLLFNLSTYFRQLTRYPMAEKEDSACVNSSTASSSFVVPKETDSLFFQYDVLFDEIRDKL